MDRVRTARLDCQHELNGLPQLEPRPTDRHEQGLDVAVRHEQRVARGIDVVNHKADVGATRQTVVDVGVPPAYDSYFKACRGERVARCNWLCSDTLLSELCH